ncbi:hypothetical protein COLO4_20500 [Corchorus olitorius]|uniref:Uncharacterized protein n=1 Tax=Corchorus olitorius TaxID=93759 RepID=A0A1R3IZM8_9ROSI|nr:hypothetical protein COLO4_20500 [Corchorus olitorius]
MVGMSSSWSSSTSESSSAKLGSDEESYTEKPKWFKTRRTEEKINRAHALGCQKYQKRFRTWPAVLELSYKVVRMPPRNLKLVHQPQSLRTLVQSLSTERGLSREKGCVSIGYFFWSGVVVVSERGEKSEEGERFSWLFGVKTNGQESSHSVKPNKSK